MKEINKKKLDEYLTMGTFKDNNNKFSFRNTFNNNMTGLVQSMITPWMINCLQKYSEQEFHQIMKSGNYTYENKQYQGFDFIKDWEINHHRKISMFRKMAKTMKNVINFDDRKFLEKIVTVLETQEWNLTVQEIQCLHHTILKVKDIIYNN